jgi:prolipoprotein diacylglyceryltransferase
MEANNKDILNQTLDALERLLKLFRIERIVYLCLVLVGFALLVYAVVQLLQSHPQGLSPTVLAALFGSSGLITVSGARTTYLFNKAFKLVEHVINVLIKSGGPS